MRNLLVAIALLCMSVRHARADEAARVRAHLEAALAYVQTRDIAHLAPAQQANRARAITALERYIARGEFPRRTDDAYVGLRPRFIDDRGVHCAVGQLIADSGAPQLARAIAAAHEYAYVPAIAESSAALRAWATEHGFTVDELARIQPAYSAPPTPDGVREELERDKGEIILACVGADPPPDRIAVRAVGDDHGNVRIETRSSDAFARCFASEATKRQQWGGAHSPSPEAFASGFTVDVPSPQQLLDRAITERIGYGPDCTPRPGAVPRAAVIDIASTERELSIRVTTKPENREVETCIADYLRPKLARYAVRHIQWSRRIDLAPRVSTRNMQSKLLHHGPGYATDCYSVEAPARIELVATARRDDTQFAIHIEGAYETFTKCVADKLQPKLRAALAVPRVRGGKTEHYFRIDADVKARVVFALETPTARAQRLAKQRKEEKRLLREALEELKRPRP